MKTSNASILAPAAALLLALAVAGPAQATTWVASGLGGGGTQNCIAIDPNNDQIVISAADISGIQRSTDGGKSWIGVNLGTGGSGAQKVATVAWSNLASDTVYAGTGDAGSGGGFYVSTDGGIHWSASTNGPQPIFCGNGTSLRWPRDTGNLIVSDPAGYIYAGSFNSGVMRSTDGGQTWTDIGLNSYEITGLTWDPAHPAHIYVTTRGNYTWWTSIGRGMAAGTGTANWTQIVSGPAFAEEALVLGGSTLYVVGATTDDGGNYDKGGGIWSDSVLPEPGPSFTQLGTSGSYVIPTGTSYTGLAGSGSGSSAILYIGAANPISSSDSPTIIRSTDGGSTWAPVSLTANVNYTIFDGSGAEFWEKKTGGPSAYLLGNGQCAVSQIEIDPTSNAKIIMAGRSGLWGTQNGSAASTAVGWYPYDGGYTASASGAGGGISVTEGTTVATDPRNAGRAYYCMGDFGFAWSTDSGGSWQADSPSGGGSMGRGIWVDPVNSTVYVGKKGDNGATTPSDIFSSSNPATTGWTDLNLAPGNANDEEFGIGGAHDSSSGTIYVFACVAGPDAGLYRYSSSSKSWGLVASGIKPNTNVNPLITFGWTPGDTNVFVYEQSTGLWRGSNWGATWTKIYSGTSDSVGTGFVVADPSVAGRLYLSTTSGVYRFTGADSGTGLTPTAMSTPSNFNPGALALSAGNLYCCGVGSSSVNGSMIEYSNPSGSTSYSTISDSVNYPGQSNWPADLAVDPAGRIVVGEREEGMMLGK